MIGLTFSNIQDIFDSNIPTHDRAKYFTFLGGLIALAIISICIIVYLIIFTVRTYKKSKLKLEENEN